MLLTTNNYAFLPIQFDGASDIIDGCCFAAHSKFAKEEVDGLNYYSRGVWRAFV